jgi:hypothetical protein
MSKTKKANGSNNVVEMDKAINVKNKKGVSKTVTDEEALEYVNEYEKKYIHIYDDNDSEDICLNVNENDVFIENNMNVFAYDSDNDNTMVNNEETPEELMHENIDFDSDDESEAIDKLKTKYAKKILDAKN